MTTSNPPAETGTTTTATFSSRCVVEVEGGRGYRLRFVRGDGGADDPDHATALPERGAVRGGPSRDGANELEIYVPPDQRGRALGLRTGRPYRLDELRSIPPAGASSTGDGSGDRSGGSGRPTTPDRTGTEPRRYAFTPATTVDPL